MIYTVTWGLDEQTDDTRRARVDHAGLDQLLDTIEATRSDDGTPFIVTIIADDDPHAQRAIQLGVGHPDRAVLLYYGEPGGYAYQPDLALWPESIAFDLNGEATDYKPTRTRITPAAARASVREYVATDHRQFSLALDPDA